MKVFVNKRIFQFHIVRLKDWERDEYDGYTYISIPYSSIKRENALKRLKISLFISIPYSSIKSMVDFQHLYDLTNFNSI